MPHLPRAGGALILIPAPPKIGSYLPDDVTLLLKDLSGVALERDVRARERDMQGPGHYSETLPIEYRPTGRYRETFEEILSTHADETALLVATLADRLINRKGDGVVIVSLARAGTPIGVLVRRAIAARHGISVPHYSISIIRDRGIDRQALRFILQRHRPGDLQFLDGWTGKGTITNELRRSLAHFSASDGFHLDPELAVLADPGRTSSLFATREDALIPSACLNATIAGLISRTVLNEDVIGPNDFHGAKWYRELAAEDVSQRFIDTIAARFGDVAPHVAATIQAASRCPPPDQEGRRVASAIAADLSLPTINLVKPGIGETTRMLLRRRPWLVIVNPAMAHRLHHVQLLARERRVRILPRRDMPFACCGVIRPEQAPALP
jgi:hypothetical protein